MHKAVALFLSEYVANNGGDDLLQALKMERLALFLNDSQPHHGVVQLAHLQGQVPNRLPHVSPQKTAQREEKGQ